MDSQLKKGLLDACVLADLLSHDNYGYMLLQDISPIVSISESTLYPILRRLEKAGALRTYTQEKDGRLRKYYSITIEGKRKLDYFIKEWAQVVKVYDYIIRRLHP